MPKLTGQELLERLDSGLIDSDNLTNAQRKQVMLAQEDRSQKKLHLRKGGRTRFGLGSWKYPTDESLKKKKSSSKKLRM